MSERIFYPEKIFPKAYNPDAVSVESRISNPYFLVTDAAERYLIQDRGAVVNLARVLSETRDGELLATDLDQMEHTDLIKRLGDKYNQVYEEYIARLAELDAFSDDDMDED